MSKETFRNQATIRSKLGVGRARACFSTMALLLPLMLLSTISFTSATILVSNQHYPSMPGVFGMPWRPNIVYRAHLQLPPTTVDPLLCGDSPEEGDRWFLQPPRKEERRGHLRKMLLLPFADTVDVDSLAATSEPADPDPQAPTGDSPTIVTPPDGLPVALLVPRGSCSFEDKARFAMSISPAIQFLIVYDDHMRTQLVPMSASDPAGITLGMLFIARTAGLELTLKIKQQSANATAEGGLLVEMDARLPLWPVGPSYEEEQQWLLAALAGFFTFLACFGCLLVCILAGYIPADGRIVINGRTIVAASSRRLLTEAQVSMFPEEPFEAQDECDDRACAICIDDYQQGEMLRVLPCSHKFHSECILPWLTERHASCPLCKQDIAPPEEQQEETDNEEEEGQDSEEGSRPRHSWSFWMLSHRPLRRRRRHALPTEEHQSGRSVLAESPPPVERTRQERTIDDDETEQELPVALAETA